jgi:hypothetical protein
VLVAWPVVAEAATASPKTASRMPRRVAPRRRELLLIYFSLLSLEKRPFPRRD